MREAPWGGVSGMTRLLEFILCAGCDHYFPRSQVEEVVEQGYQVIYLCRECREAIRRHDDHLARRPL